MRRGQESSRGVQESGNLRTNSSGYEELRMQQDVGAMENKTKNLTLRYRKIGACSAPRSFPLVELYRVAASWPCGCHDDATTLL